MKSYVRIKRTDTEKLSVSGKLKIHDIQMQCGMADRILEQKKKNRGKTGEI